MEVKNCSVCGAEFRQREGEYLSSFRKRLTCGGACSRRRAILEERRCPVCQRQFSVPVPSKQRLCSRTCADRSKHTYRDCGHCGRSFRVTAQEARYCSRACSGLAHRSDKGGQKTCVTCGLTKPVADFHRQHGKGYRSACKVCRRVQSLIERNGSPDPKLISYPITFDEELGQHVRECNDCHHIKPIGEFYKHARNTTFPNCKPCYNAVQRLKNQAQARSSRRVHHVEFLPDLGISVKRCSACNILRPVTLYRTRANGQPASRCNQCDAAKRKEHRLLNRSRIIARQRAYFQADPEKWRQYHREHRQTHKDQYLDSSQRRRARLHNAPAIERIDRAAVIARDVSTCYLCKRLLTLDEITLDHIIPLARGGTHTSDNLKVACRGCNSRKGVRRVELVAAELHSRSTQ